MWGWFSFGAFGLLVGTLCGLSTSPVTIALMPLLFTFAGGSIFAFFGKMGEETRTAAYTALGAASLGALIGIYSSILLSTHEVLGPSRTFSDGSKGVLRFGSVSAIEMKLKQMENSKEISPEIADKIRAELYKPR